MYICTAMKWIYPQEISADKIETLSAELKGIPWALAQMLWQRSIKNLDSAKEFFYPDENQIPDPFFMADMSKAAERLARAISLKEPVFLLGDYDVDGTTSVSMMYVLLEALNVPVFYHIPDRYKEGYGISYVGIDAAKASGAQLLITLDCGIRSIDQLKYAQQQGLEVIVCDHHEPGVLLPEVYAVLNPKRKDCLYPFKELSGCGVGYKLMQATFKLLDLPQEDLLAVADLLALSIACDLVSVTGENRVYLSRGLEKLRTNPLPGLKAMMQLSDKERPWNVSDLVFFLGPRINAAGRITHARHAVDVLVGKSGDLSLLAQKLEEDNRLRKLLDESHTFQALELIESQKDFSLKRSTVLFHPEWHKGLVGIVASRVIERHYKPTVLLARSEGKWVGSARSVASFDLYKALSECKEHLLQFGGHKYAAGLTVSEENLEPFCLQFEKVVAEQIEDYQLYPQLLIDALIPLPEITSRFLKMVNRMEPFGPGNMQPVFVSKPVQARNIRILKDKHLKFTACQNNTEITAIAFGMLDKLPLIESDEFAIAYHAGFNYFQGEVSLQLMIKDIQVLDT